MSDPQTVELADLVEFNSGGTPSRKDAAFWGGNIPWVSGKDMKSFKIKDSIEHITNAAVSNGVRVVSPGSILILVRGMALFKGVPISQLVTAAAFNQDVKALVAKDGVDPVFLAYSVAAQEHNLRSYVSTAGHGTGRLITEALETLPIWLPAFDEQQRIAAVLDAWDRAIASSESLVSAKDNYQSAIRKRLLTGEIRLPGFSDEWKWVVFSEVFDRVRQKNDVGNTNVLTISAQKGLISQLKYFNKSVASEDVRGYTLLKRGDFAYNKSYSDGYPMGALKPLEHYEAGIVSSLYICFRMKSQNHNQNFLKYYFDAGAFNEEIAGIAQEGARNHGLLNVSVVEFFETGLFVPCRDEQDAIASVLDSIAGDLTLERQRLALLRNQKRGLMQKLLTGQLRVPESIDALLPGVSEVVA